MEANLGEPVAAREIRSAEARQMPIGRPAGQSEDAQLRDDRNGQLVLDGAVEAPVAADKFATPEPTYRPLRKTKAKR